MQDKNFETTRQLLFDGESALKSKKVQEEIRRRFDIKIHAEPYWKRSMAERAIYELKLRMSIHLDFEGNAPPPPAPHTWFQFFYLLGLALNKWRDHLQFVLDSINRNKKDYRSRLNMLISYFTASPVINVPQQSAQFYKYKIRDKVRIDLNKTQRTALGFKYSLYYGMPRPPSTLLRCSNIYFSQANCPKVCGES